MTHNINIGDDLWPIVDDWLRYIGDDTNPYHFDDLKLTHNNEYQVYAIRFLPCADAIKIQDDNGYFHWVELRKFSFLDYNLELFNG